MDQQNTPPNQPILNQPSITATPDPQQVPTVQNAPLQPDATPQDHAQQTPAPTIPQTIASQTSSEAPQETNNYTKNVGQAMVDLLTDISLSDVKKEKIATEMNLSVEKIGVICSKILEKVDAEDITEEDLAFLMTAPLADSTTEQNPTS